MDTLDKEKKTQDKEMNTCTDTRTREDTHKDINNGDSAQRTDRTRWTLDSDIYIKEKNIKTVYKCTWKAMCNELANVYVILLCPILPHSARCPSRYIYNCVGQ